jgi:hypothetical protein
MPLAGKKYLGYFLALGALKIPSQIGRYLFCESQGDRLPPFPLPLPLPYSVAMQAILFSSAIVIHKPQHFHKLTAVNSLIISQLTTRP